jgi:hypothetical protein
MVQCLVIISIPKCKFIWYTCVIPLGYVLFHLNINFYFPFKKKKCLTRLLRRVSFSLETNGFLFHFHELLIFIFGSKQKCLNTILKFWKFDNLSEQDLNNMGTEADYGNLSMLRHLLLFLSAGQDFANKFWRVVVTL